MLTYEDHIELFWEDLNAEAQEALGEILGGNNNFDIIPIACIGISEDQKKTYKRPPFKDGLSALRGQIYMRSIVSYPDRGTDGKNTYRGNCSGLLIEDLIKQFKVKQISDFMVGSGTTEDVAYRMGIQSNCFDLNRGYLI